MVRRERIEDEKAKIGRKNITKKNVDQEILNIGNTIREESDFGEKFSRDPINKKGKKTTSIGRKQENQQKPRITNHKRTQHRTNN